MTAFKDRSIKAKLILLTTVCSSLALLLCSTGFVLHDFASMRAAKVEQIQTQAEMLAFNSTAVLTFQDAVAAEELLAALEFQPEVTHACLFDFDQNPLAVYARGKSAENSISDMKMASGHSFTKRGELDLYLPVMDGGENVGTLFIRASMDHLNERVLSYLKIAAIMLIGALSVSTILALMLQKMISRPVEDLAQAAKNITESDDYSIRVEPVSQDEIGNLYRSFNDMLEQVECSRNALRGAVANMSHEIRTPINAILGFTELLMNGAHEGDEQERQDYLATIESSGKHLLELINDILDLSKIEAGQMEFDRINCSPHHIISEVASVLRVKAREKQLCLDYEWSGPVPEVICTDPGRLRQLLINLVGNSIKFTQMGGIHILARLAEDGSERLIVDVIDSGIGIPSDRISSVFDPFVQADNTVTRRFGGTGLGLPISRKIALALGGDLEVRSESGKGSTFTVTVETGSLDGVRMIESGGVDISIPRMDETKSPQPVDQLPDCRILVVDDGDTNRKLIRLLLARSGATVVLAENGQIGYERAMQQPFDVILMDMQMPVMDGYTATAKLREAGLEIPIIALTAHAMSSDEKKCRQAGCSGYLTKPINGARLLKALSEALEGRPESVRSTSTSTVGPCGTESHTGADNDETCVTSHSAQPDTANGAPIYSILPTEDADFLEIVLEFLERLRQKKTELQDAWESRDLSAVAEIAHWLKGSGGTAGFSDFTEPAKELELFARQGRLESIIDPLSRIEQLIDRAAVREQEAHAGA